MFIGGAVWRARLRHLVTHADVRNLVTRVRGHVTSSLACRRHLTANETIFKIYFLVSDVMVFELPAVSPQQALHDVAGVGADVARPGRTRQPRAVRHARDVRAARRLPLGRKRGRRVRHAPHRKCARARRACGRAAAAVQLGVVRVAAAGVRGGVRGGLGVAAGEEPVVLGLRGPHSHDVSLNEAQLERKSNDREGKLKLQTAQSSLH